MKKDAFYFPHFSNARNDARIIKLRRVLGIEGYGLYFMLLEVLREQTDFQFPLAGIEDLSYEWHISREKIISVVNDYDLFTINDLNFFSEKLIMYLQPYLEKSKRAIEAANTRWNNAKAYANALPEHCIGNTSKVKESKVKESKVYSSEAVFLNEFSKSKFDEKYISGKSLKMFDDLLKLDKYSKEEIVNAISWARADEFWSKNFLSPLKLRSNDKHGVKFIDRFLVKAPKIYINPVQQEQFPFGTPRHLA